MLRNSKEPFKELLEKLKIFQRNPKQLKVHQRNTFLYKWTTNNNNKSVVKKAALCWCSIKNSKEDTDNVVEIVLYILTKFFLDWEMDI